jgi:hypothetical protein
MPHLNSAHEHHKFYFENNDHKSKLDHPSSSKTTKLTKIAKKNKNSKKIIRAQERTSMEEILLSRDSGGLFFFSC